MFKAAGEFVEGLRFHIKGIRFGFQNVPFLILSALPFLMTLTLYALGFYTFTLYADDLLRLLWDIDPLQSSKYVGWLYWAYIYILKWLLYLVALVILFYTFIVVSNILASPFYDQISIKYERTHGQQGHENLAIFPARGVLTVMKEEVKKAVLMLFVPLILVFIPLVGSLLGFLVAAIFIAWDYVDFSLSRNYPLMKDRIKLVWKYKFFFLGFGCPILIPFFGLLMMPLAVLGATMLYFDKIKQVPDGG